VLLLPTYRINIPFYFQWEISSFCFIYKACVQHNITFLAHQSSILLASSGSSFFLHSLENKECCPNVDL
ncbi:unnamed protein product, partial [Larinioides sclopetarius]